MYCVYCTVVGWSMGVTIIHNNSPHAALRHWTIIIMYWQLPIAPNHQLHTFRHTRLYIVGLECASLMVVQPTAHRQQMHAQTCREVGSIRVRPEAIMLFF